MITWGTAWTVGVAGAAAAAGCGVDDCELLQRIYTADVLANVASHSVGCLFILLMFSFAVQNLFSLM